MSKKIVEVQFEKDEHAQKHLHYTRFGFELLKSESWTTRKESSDRIIREYMKNIYQFDKDRPHAKERLRLFRKYKWMCVKKDERQRPEGVPTTMMLSCIVVCAVLGALIYLGCGYTEFVDEIFTGVLLSIVAAMGGTIVGIIVGLIWAGITYKKRLLESLAGTKELDEQIEQITLEAQKLL